MTMMPQDFISDDAVEDFLASSYEKLNVMEECLAAKNATSMATLKRHLHSLKGNAQTYAFDDLARLCHRMENDLMNEKDWRVEICAQVSVYLVHIDVALGHIQNPR